MQTLNQFPQNEFVGRSKAPELFKQYGVNSIDKLRKIFDAKYSFLKKIIDRTPTSALYPNLNKLQSLVHHIKTTKSFKFFMTWIDFELDYIKARLLIVMYGICEFGNVIRLEYDHRKPYFFTSFPFHLWDDAYVPYLRKNLHSVDLAHLKDVIQKQLILTMDEKTRKKYSRFCNTYRYADETLIVDLSIEWHLEGIGNNLDKPKPFLKFVCLLPEVMTKILYFLKQTRSPYKKVIIDKAQYEELNEDFSDICDRKKITQEQYKNIAKKYKPLIEKIRNLNGTLQYIKYERMVYKSDVQQSWVYQLNISHPQQNQYKKEKQWNLWEADNAFVIKFLKDMNLKSSEWWTIKNVKNFMTTPYIFNVDMNVSCQEQDLQPLPSDDPISRKFPDDIIFLFDGEMIGKAGHFPNAKHGDAVGQLGIHVIRSQALLNRYSLKESCEKDLFCSIILTALPVKNFTSVFNDENNKYNVRVLKYVRKGHDENNNNQMEEFQMLKEFCEMIIYSNPSYIFAYNGNRFDWPYIIDRLWLLYNDTDVYNRPMYDWNINNYIYVTRDFRSNKGIFHEKAKKVGTEQLAKASARVSYDKVKIVGISNIDLYLYVKQFAKYGMKSSYSLDAASMKYLKEKKIEINYDFIPILFQKESGRLSIAKYCNRDVELMTRLINVLGVMEFIYFIGQIAIIPAQDMVDRGTQFLVDGIWYTSDAVYNHLILYNQKNPNLVKYFTERHQRYKQKYFVDQTTDCMMLLPEGTFYLKDLEGPISKDDTEKGGGADVIEAPTMNTSNVQTLDFASLYPSIMMTFGICPTTLIWYKNRQKIIEKVKKIRDRFGISPKESLFKRKESWFCTGDKPQSHVSLEAALAFLNSESCDYPIEMKKLLQKIAKKLFEKHENIALIQKYEPLALNDYDKLSDEMFSEEEKSDASMERIFLDIVEPICQLTGKTKVQYKNKQLPIFLGKGIRQGVLPWRQQQLFALRAQIKREMNEAAAEIERLLREGVPKSDPRIKKLEAKKKECDVKQQAVKCAMNSIYGWLTSRLLAKSALQETVCVCGQFLLQDTTCFIDSMGKRVLGFLANYITTSGDTDSDFAAAEDVPHSEARVKFLIKIQKDYSQRIELQPAKKVSSIDKLTQVEFFIKDCINNGTLDQKFSSKACLLLQWKVIFDDLFFGIDEINILYFYPDETVKLTAEDHAMLAFLKKWFDQLFINMNVYFDDAKTSEWRNIREAPDPPLFSREGTDLYLKPQNFRMFIRWLHINMLFESGRRTERIVNRIFATKYNGVIKQELEKIYEYIIWWRKKKYAGCVWMPGASAPSIKATGIASVRGDCFPYKSKLCEDIVYLLLEENDDEKAIKYAYDCLLKIMQGKVSVHEFIQSKNIKKDLMEYGKKPQRTKIIDVAGNKLMTKVDLYDSSVIRIQENMPVHVKNAIRRYLEHQEPLPQIDDRYHFIVMANYGTKPIQISERGIPPLAILKSNGIIHYDKTYYAECCVKQISSLLEPIIDKRSKKEKMKQAEKYRRIKDKKVRNEMIEKFSRKQRAVIEKHFTNFIKTGFRTKNNASMFKTQINLDNRQKNDIRSFFMPQSLSDSTLQITTTRKRLCHETEINIELLDEIQGEKKEESQTLSVEHMIDNLDSYSSTIPFTFNQYVEDLILNDSGEKKELCVSCQSMKIRNKACSNCNAMYVHNDKQSNILHFFKRQETKCILCNSKNTSTVCFKCRAENGLEKLNLLRKSVQDKRLKNDCQKCAVCFGVDVPQEIEGKDIEEIISEFYEEHQPIKYCTAITCANRWSRDRNDRRIDVLKKIQYDYDHEPVVLPDDSEAENEKNDHDSLQNSKKMRI